MSDRPYDDDATPQLGHLTLDAPDGHRVHFEIRRSDAEVAASATPHEPTDHVRQRLGPRLRCECGRGFSSYAALIDHHADPLRDERDRSYT